MTLSKIAPYALALAGTGWILGAPPAVGQTPAPNVTVPTYQESPGAALGRYLNVLAQNPNSVSALMGAGKASLDVGDPNAALTFFARAEEQAPRDGRIKMWIGSALVQLEQSGPALKFFADAIGLGVPEADLAGDRGLAHDMRGDQKSAQRDYALALRRGANPEVTRRLALSLAIGGQREPALKLLEDQMARRDRAAARTRALVLALTGDAARANEAARASMPAPQAAAMAPFLARLPSLSPAQRALAVHFGHMPGDGRIQIAQAQPQARPSLPPPRDTRSTSQAGQPDRGQPALGTRPVPVPPSATVSKPRTSAVQTATAVPGRRTTTGTPVQSGTNTQAARIPPAVVQTKPATTASRQPSTSPSTAIRQPAATANAQPAVSQPTLSQSGSTAPEGQAQRPTVLAASNGEVVGPPAPQAGASTSIATPTASAPVTPGTTIPASPQADPAPASAGGLADIAALVAALPETETPTRTAATVPARTQAKPAAKPGVAASQPAPRAGTTSSAGAKQPVARTSAPVVREPSRHWVQIAGGADKLALPREFARLKAKASAAFGARAAWTTPLSATNRLLVGPFRTEAEAQEFVNQLAKADLPAFSWTSPAGQAIEKLPAR